MKTEIIIGTVDKTLEDLIEKLFALVPSSASLKRAFSAMSLTHSDSRNGLWHENVAKFTCAKILIN